MVQRRTRVGAEDEHTEHPAVGAAVGVAVRLVAQRVQHGGPHRHRLGPDALAAEPRVQALQHDRPPAVHDLGQGPSPVGGKAQAPGGECAAFGHADRAREVRPLPLQQVADRERHVLRFAQAGERLLQPARRPLTTGADASRLTVRCRRAASTSPVRSPKRLRTPTTRPSRSRTGRNSKSHQASRSSPPRISRCGNRLTRTASPVSARCRNGSTCGCVPGYTSAWRRARTSSGARGRSGSAASFTSISPSGPHRIIAGSGASIARRTTARRYAGQVCTRPNGVAEQSIRCAAAATSPASPNVARFVSRSSSGRGTGRRR